MPLIGPGWNQVRQQSNARRRWEKRQQEAALSRLAEETITPRIKPLNIYNLPNSNSGIRDISNELGKLLPDPSLWHEFLINKNAENMCWR